MNFFVFLNLDITTYPFTMQTFLTLNAFIIGLVSVSFFSTRAGIKLEKIHLDWYIKGLYT